MKLDEMIMEDLRRRSVEYITLWMELRDLQDEIKRTQRRIELIKELLALEIR